MSIAKAKAFIEEAIAKKYSEVPGFKNIRQNMNMQITTLDISFNTFKVNNKVSDNESEKYLKYYYDLFITLIRQALTEKRVFSTLEKANKVLANNGLVVEKVVLIKFRNSATLIGNTYDDIRGLLTFVTKDPRFKDTVFGRTKKTRVDPQSGEILSFSRKEYSVLEMGHTGEQTPFAEQINAVIQNPGSDAVLVNSLKSILEDLGKTQANLNYTFLNTSDNANLGTAVVKLVIQPRYINANFSKEESALYAQFLRAIRYSLKTQEVPGSNTLIQDAKQFGIDKLSTALTGKKQANVKKHAPVKDTVKLSVGKTKVTAKPYTEIIKVPQISRTTDVFYSLTSLQQLINDSLQHVIAANMGDGDQNRILNYRTGRFAASAQVERMSKSRAGMITAFYSYMKYPYQTFEPGFRQGSPATRDPKLLIAKSIREIAATKVGNRLRAVSI